MPDYAIDVSSWNGAVDWANVKRAGVHFAVLKAIRKDLAPDKQFLANLRGVRTQGIPYGVYTYVYEGATKGAQKRANAVVTLLQKQDVPAGTMVWWDVENGSIEPVGPTARNNLKESILAAQKIIRAAGYGFGIYTGLWWYNSIIKPMEISVPYWIARYPVSGRVEYGDEPSAKYKPDVDNLWGWQYTDACIVPGCTGNSGKVDCSVVYGVAKPSTETPKTSTLKRGSRGDVVKLLQAELNNHGYHLAVDGIFGPKTETAVRAFQAEKGLVVDGIAGPKTWAAVRT